MPLQALTRCPGLSTLLVVFAFFLPFILASDSWCPWPAVGLEVPMSTPYEHVLEIDDALVSEENPARADGKLDVERCVRLHNYIAARGWMAKHQKRPQDLGELLQRPSYFQFFQDEVAQTDLRRKLEPDLVRFLESIFGMHDQNDPEFFRWVTQIATPNSMIEHGDTIFSEEAEANGNKPQFLILFHALSGPSHPVGLVYDQLRRHVALTLSLWDVESVTPITNHPDMWYPLETMLSRWIQFIHLGKAAPLPDHSRSEFDWDWKLYSTQQVDRAVEAFDRLAAAIESRMPARSLAKFEQGITLFTDEQLDAASVPSDCFARSFLSKVRKPRFSTIAPGLQVPHDASAFAGLQAFTDVEPGQRAGDETDPFETEDRVWIAPILLFAATERSRKARLEKQWPGNYFLWQMLPKPKCQKYLFNMLTWCDSNYNLVPAGLYSEGVEPGASSASPEGASGDGFSLLLPNKLRTSHSDLSARLSDGRLVTEGSISELFQQGLSPFAGLQSQRLERLLNRWRELVEEGVWRVGRTGVMGTIDEFTDSPARTWRYYWIPPER